MRMNEFLANTNNPLDQQFIGQHRRDLLREVMKNLPIDRDKILPEEQDAINQLTGPTGPGGEVMSQTGAPQQPIQPATLSPSGGQMGGRDFATMQGARV